MKKRLFVGIPLTAEFRDALRAPINQMKALKVFPEASVRWTAVENLHITVCFLGSIEEKYIGGITDVLRSLVSEHAQFPLTFDTVSLAPLDKPRRMIWAVFKPNSDFSLFVTQVCGKLEQYLREEMGRNIKLTLDRENTAHVTLARLKGQLKVNEALPQLGTQLRSMPVFSCMLYESQTLPSGPVYTALGTFYLKGNA